MHRITPNNSVRRRLVFEDEQIQDAPTHQNNVIRVRPILGENLKEQASTDNSVNILLESILRDRVEKSLKWSFDFEKEEALLGQYEWYKKEHDEWVFMEPKINHKCLRYINENTPLHLRHDSIPLAKKRKSNIDSKTCGPSAKRKIDFD